MAKQRTTTLDPIISMYFKSSEAEYLDEILMTMKGMIAVGIVLSVLAIIFLCCLPGYVRSFRKHLQAHGTTGFLPLLIHSFRTLLYNYPMFFVLSILSAIFSTFETRGADSTLNYLTYVFALAINWYAAMYQLAISIISIHRFINNRQPKEFRGNLSRKNVIVVMVLAFLSVIMRDVAMIAWTIFVMTSQQFSMLGTMMTYYLVMYATYQLLLFIGMAFQFSLSSEPATSHSESVIAKQTKTIGAIKFVLFVLAGISLLTQIQSTIALSLFISIDVFLVPVVVEITEMSTDPNVIKPVEVKKEALKV